MKLNGNTQAALLGVILTSTIGWGSYITNSLSAQQIQTAVIESKIDSLTKRLAEILEHLHRDGSVGTLGTGDLP